MGRSRRVFLEVPDRVPVILGCLTISALVATLAGQFRPVVVLPAWALLVALTWRAVPRAPREDRAEAWSVAALLALVGGWTAWGVTHSGEYLVIQRDPGFLTLKAWWLVGHPSARIPAGSALQAAVGGATAETEALNLHGSSLLFQGNSAVPAVLATAGWAGGPPAVLWANVVIGAVGLVALYAVARRMVGPWWALVAAGATAVTLPMLAFTRSAYTEPLVMALALGGVAVLHGRLQGDPRGPSWAGLALGGGLVGIAGAARIDGAMLVVGAMVGLACAVLLAPDEDRRRVLARQVAVALGVMVMVTALGLVDLWVLSPTYLDEHREALLELGVGSAAAVVAIAACLVTRDRLVRLMRGRGPAAARVAQVLVVVVALGLASRPFWLTVRDGATPPNVVEMMSNLQATDGLPIDPTRTYAEQTVTWLAWYLGWPAVVAAVAGAVLLVRRSTTGRDAVSAVFLSVAVIGSAFYLVQPSIIPDQIWAVRRFMPVTIPSAVLLAAVSAAALWASGRRTLRVTAVALAVALVTVPVTAWHGLERSRQYSGQLELAERTCDALEAADVDRVVWLDWPDFAYVATLRVVCGVDVIQFLTQPTTGQLAQVASAWDDEPVMVLSLDPTRLGLAVDSVPLVSPVATSQWAASLTGPPPGPATGFATMWASVLGADGTLTPLASAGGSVAEAPAP